MQVLLVGGATRMPAFRRFVENMTGLQPRETLVDPDEVRAKNTLKILFRLLCIHSVSSGVLQFGLFPAGAQLCVTYAGCRSGSSGARRDPGG